MLVLKAAAEFHLHKLSTYTSSQCNTESDSMSQGAK